MEFQLTWTITTIIAVSALLSPILVALINNRHQTKMKKLELQHTAKLKQFDIYYADKKVAFSAFALSAANFNTNRQNAAIYSELQMNIENCLLLCNKQNQKILIDFTKYTNNLWGTSCPPEQRIEYSNKLCDIMLSLNHELSSTKPT